MKAVRDISDDITEEIDVSAFQPPLENDRRLNVQQILGGMRRAIEAFERAGGHLADGVEALKTACGHLEKWKP